MGYTGKFSYIKYISHLQYFQYIMGSSGCDTIASKEYMYICIYIHYPLFCIFTCNLSLAYYFPFDIVNHLSPIFSLKGYYKKNQSYLPITMPL